MRDESNIAEKRTPGSRSGGFLFDLPLLPPVVVLIISFLMACILGQIGFNQNKTPSIVNGKIASFFTPEIQYWETKIIDWSEDWNLDPNIIATVMQIESCGSPFARSNAGAMGLFQVMPYHFSQNEDPYKPNINARRGLAYLKKALDAQGNDPRLAFASYNGGISGAKQPETAWAAETIRYVYWANGIYADASQGKTHSESLNDWLTAGGVSLCKKAAEDLGINR